MKTVAKKLLGLLVLGLVLLLAACSQTLIPTDALEAQTCATARPLDTGYYSYTVRPLDGPDGVWFRGSNLTVSGSPTSDLVVRNPIGARLQVEIVSFCSSRPLVTIDIPVTAGNVSIPLPDGPFFVHFIAMRGQAFNISYTHRPILVDPCKDIPGGCPVTEVPRQIPGECLVCNFDLNILKDILESYRIRLTLPELGLKPDHFAKAFAFNILTPEGKLIAQAQGNSKEAALELSTKLPKGSYKLQVSILDQTIAKMIHANPQKYPFKFGFSVLK